MIGATGMHDCRFPAASRGIPLRKTPRRRSGRRASTQHSRARPSPPAATRSHTLPLAWSSSSSVDTMQFLPYAKIVHVLCPRAILGQTQRNFRLMLDVAGCSPNVEAGHACSTALRTAACAS
eukprot:4968708-Pleurochrysis_carterae.AAC.2